MKNLSLFEIRHSGSFWRSDLSEPLLIRGRKGGVFILEKVDNVIFFRPLKGEGKSLTEKAPTLEKNKPIRFRWPGLNPVKIKALNSRLPAFMERDMGKSATSWISYRVLGARIMESRYSTSPIDSMERGWVTVGVDAPEFVPSKSAKGELDPFMKVSARVMGGVLLFFLLIFLIPKSDKKEEELIPAQFAKVILTPKKVAAAPQQVQKVATVKQLSNAVNSKTFQKSFQKLIKGGGFAKMNAFQGFQALKGATFGPGSGGGLTGSLDRAMNQMSKGGNVAAIGGGASGYAGAQQGGVSGQGSSFVGLDTEGSNVEEGLTRDEVGRVIHAHMSEIRYCYESAIQIQEGLMSRTDTKFILDFSIHPDGIARSAKSKESTFPDSRVADCVIRRLGLWKFPKPRGGVQVAVTYPFQFKSVRR